MKLKDMFRHLAVFSAILLAFGTMLSFADTSASAASYPVRRVKLSCQEKEIVRGKTFRIRVKRALSTDTTSFSIQDTAVASISSSDTTSCTIRANAVGSTRLYASVYRNGTLLRTLKCKITVTPAAASVRFRTSSLSVEKGDEEDLMRLLSIKPKYTAELPVFSVEDSSIVAVDKDGTVYGLKTGTTSVTATISSGRSDTLSVTVESASSGFQRHSSDYAAELVSRKSTVSKLLIP